ncbi:4Fe-4S ferredoxin [Dethiosulfatarculus sandiegensis]|uniref:4Fe-4S ferredoxin n=2 Tax=Dethiosulfatarculus sandiegensis TaxID=1429043 RepID=A0A0D2JTB5_9BACT|nr:4Fe-4S ferredoxin [Dethiosulfatarculus sandiegensis]
MKEAVIKRARTLMESGQIGGFLGLKQQGDQIAPYLFTRPDELNDLCLGDKDRPGDCRYPLVKVLFDLAARFPKEVFGLMARGCDERALNVLINEDRTSPLHKDRVVVVGFSCPEELANHCQCHKPWPDQMVAGEKTKPVILAGQTGAETLPDLMEQWLGITQTCMKCMGCKNVCPVCVCQECTVEQDALVPQRQLPPTPNFLITRAVHMVGRCVYCGLCEEACPAGIPLKDLYRMVSRVLGQENLLPVSPLVQDADQSPEQTVMG